MTRLITTQKPVTDLVREFADGDLAIPEIQRDFVWKPEQVKKLIGSIFSQFPCGSLIFWEPREKDAHLVKSMIRPERLKQYDGKLPKYFLLDGQQRLTALASVLLSRPQLKEVLAEIEEDMPYIYCNLKRFPGELEAINDASGYTFPWFPVQEVLDGSVSRNESVRTGLGDAKFKNVILQAQNLCNYQFPVQIIQDRDYTDVAEIFARVNSLGTPLTGAEIHLARLVPYWKGITTDFRKYRKELREKNYDLDLSFLMRAITAVECDTAQIAKLTQRMAKDHLTPRHLKQSWRQAKKAINRVISVLETELCLDRARYLPSKNALIPLVYYLTTDRSKTKATRQMMRFFIFSQLSERYGGGAETTFRNDFRVLTDENDTPRQNLEYLAKAVDTEARQYYRGLKVRPDDVSGLPAKNVMLLLMYILMRQQKAADWGAEQKTQLKDIEPSDMHIHHIFPFNFMMKDKNARAYADKEELNPSAFRAQINDIANMTFLSNSMNSRIGDLPPWQYLTQETTKEKRRAHFIPEDRSLWYPEKFSEFLEARRELIAKAATKLLKSLK